VPDYKEPRIDGSTGEEVTLIPEGRYDAVICELGEPTFPKTSGYMPYMRMKVRIKNDPQLHNHEVFSYLGGAFPTLQLFWAMREKFQGETIRIVIKHEIFQGRSYHSARLTQEPKPI
jgi:hypothetical protein